MTHEQDTAHAHDSQLPRSSRDRDDAVPGQRSRAEQLVGPHRPTPSGIVQRKRDGNGVAGDADAAVAAAATSSGSPLPSGLMRKFETSLGADLSAVRVHTGGASANAAQAVGARAYTLGNDIHFASGQYDPSSPTGEHLLAHEVAHTVQQAGIGRRAQFKLDVSSPGDAHELEADRAADAMVTGGRATISDASTAVHRKKTVESSGVPGGEAGASFDFAIPLVTDKELGPYSISVKLGGTAGVSIGPAEDKEGEQNKVSAGIGASHESGSGEEESSNSAALTAEAEHKFKSTPLGFEITANGDGSISPKQVSLGVGIKLTHPLGPFKVVVEPIHVDIVNWEAGKEPTFGSVKASLAVVAPPLDYALSGGRKASLSIASKLEVAGAVTPKSFAEWLAKRYGEETAARILSLGLDAIGGAEIMSAAVALAPAAVSLGVGAVSLAACAEAGARGELDKSLEEGAIDTVRANQAYALLMSGADTVDGAFGPDGAPGPRQIRAEIHATADLGALAAKQGISIETARKQLKEDPNGFTKLVRAGSAAYDVYLSKVPDAVRQWRSNNWSYAAGSTEADDIAGSVQLVRSKLFG
jgi:hypothetical protein